MSHDGSHRQQTVVHLTTVHPMMDARIFAKECQSLVAAGYRIVLIAPGAHDSEIDGISIKTVPPGRNRLHRATISAFAACRLALRTRAAIYHLHDPETIPIGVVLKALGRKVVFDAHEDLPRQVMTKPWIPRRMRRIVSSLAWALTQVASAAFDGIVAATPAVGRGYPSSKTVIVQNFPILEEFPSEYPVPYAQRSRQFIYIGGLTVERGIGTMLEALQRIPAREVRLTLAGIFSPPSFEKEARLLASWSRVDYVGWASRDKIIELLGTARGGLVTLLPTLAYIESQPTKLFEYMAASLPIIASDFPLWRETISSAGCGILVDPRDADQIAEAMTWIVEHAEEAEGMGRRGRDFVLRNFAWRSEADSLVRLYRGLTSSD